MSEVTRVGPGGPEEPSEAKKKKGVGGDSFRKMMQVGKAREVDPEEQRKRKRQFESEAETQASLTTGTPLQTSSTQPTEDDKKVGGVKFGASAPPTGAAPPSYPGVDVEQDEEEEEDYTPPPVEEDWQTTTPQQPSRPQSQPQPTSQPPQEVAPTPPGKPKKAKTHKPGPAIVPKKPKAQTTHLPKEEPAQKPESKEAFFKQLPKPEAKKPLKKEVAEAPLAEMPQPLAPGAWEAHKKLSKEEEKPSIETTEATGAEISQLLTPLEPLWVPTVFQTPAPYFQLSNEVLQLFERMAGVITVMTTTGVTETTVLLNAPDIKGSSFFGAEIHIVEYSTAPKAFNIEVRLPPTAQITQNDVNELVAAFQSKEYTTFKVNRLEMTTLPTHRLVKRKSRVEKVDRLEGE